MKFALHCATGHEFEAWFRSNDDYDTQVRRGLVECPQCGSNRIGKALMAPSLATGRTKDARKQAVMQAATDAARAEFIQRMREITATLKAGATDVGERFPEEARKIHYGEKDPEPIYGKADREEVEALVDEGIELMPLPDFPDEDQLN